MSVSDKINKLNILFNSDCKLLSTNQLDVDFVSNKYLGRKGLLNTLYSLLSKLKGKEKSDFGTLWISADSKVLINDGQHRKKAIEEALQENSDLENPKMVVWPSKYFILRKEFLLVFIT